FYNGLSLLLAFALTGCAGYDLSALAPYIQPAATEVKSEEAAEVTETADLPESTGDSVTYPEAASDFVIVSDIIPDVILEMRYYSTYNFVGDRIDGYEEPVALLTKEAATALKEVSDDLKEQGYRLKIFDAYRPQMAVDHFVNWAKDTEDVRMKEYFYPELEKADLFPQGYIMEKSGHSRGSTVDLTLFDMQTEKEVDMGGTFDYFGELSHPDYKGITDEQYENRMILHDAMTEHGFDPYAEEWWHFTLKDEPYPDTYFTFPVSSRMAGNVSADSSIEADKEEAILEFWSEDSGAAESIREYVSMVTDENSDAFIPKEDRIAVFDLDGTIIGELYPSYFEYMMFIHRALHDDTYDAPEDMKEFAKALEEGVYGGEKPENHERLHAKYSGIAYSGMTPDEFKEYTREFMNSKADGFTNLTKGDAFYKPMVSLVKYLSANDFTVYVVSGSDRTLVRTLAKEKLGIPENRIIGMSYAMVATGQEGTDGLEYVYTKDDDVIRDEELLIKTIKMNKVSAIAQEIGKVPVLSFGNTSGDQSMAQYTVNNDQYESRAYMLMCDDLEREHGNMKKADAMKEMCEECGFEPISMRDDFATIYGEEVEAVEYEQTEVEEVLEPAA
ncbi:MAG: haloacid dehalogenase-like hydrolase, partial [Lachnospiraceae bacterium]|nr:haloacid dehalogenase-like hydrolase [Lachnospiraceae bacterium]